MISASDESVGTAFSATRKVFLNDNSFNAIAEGDVARRGRTV